MVSNEGYSINAPCSLEELKDTIGVIRIRIPKKNRQHNGHKIPKG
jgi:hypothetical protein